MISVAMALALCVPYATAQKKKPAAKPKATAVKVDKLLEEKLAQMTQSTQRLVFIDSVVVDKAAFMSAYRLSPEAGSIGSYGDIVYANEQPNATAYANELGDKCYYSMEDSLGGFALYHSDKIENRWTKPETLDGIDTDVYQEANYPFMMADGTTLYFAAKGKESIGGYDIFATRFDSESGTFLKPENIGMPFNSAANDYMYAIDEYANIGWFATDRGQKAGNVCIYMFIPTEVRETYQDSGLTDEQIENLAKLNCIADTWGDGTERDEALERLKAIASKKDDKDDDKAWSFVVNDRMTYTKWADFKVADNKSKFIRLLDMKRKAAALDNALDKARDYYAASSAAERRSMAAEIRQSEQQSETMQANIKALEKEIRNSENKAR